VPLFCSNAKETAGEVSSHFDVQVPQARKPICLGFFPQLFDISREITSKVNLENTNKDTVVGNHVSEKKLYF
jgi:hypothetical protein